MRCRSARKKSRLGHPFGDKTSGRGRRVHQQQERWRSDAGQSTTSTVKYRFEPRAPVCPAMIGTSSQQSNHQAASPLRPRPASRAGMDDGHLASAGVRSVPLQANEYAQAQQRARPRPRHDGEVVGDVWVWRANTTRSEIHHAVHSTKSTPSRTSRTRFSPATLAAAPAAAAPASTRDRRDKRR